MKTHITILDGDKASTKHYTIDLETNTARKGKVSTSYLHNSLTVSIDNLADLYEVLESVRTNPNAFIIRGKGKEEVQVGVRRTKEDPQNFTEEPTAWVCLDFDEWKLRSDEEACRGTTMQRDLYAPGNTDHDAIEHIIRWDLPKEFRNVSYIYQWSSSAGLKYNGQAIKPGTNLHLFFMLDRALVDRELTAWLENIGQPEQVFDTSVFRTMTPIFVGNHIVKDERIQDVIEDSRKFGVIVKDLLEVPVPEITIKEQHINLDSISFETTNDILQKLQEVGAVHKRTGSWIKLKHPREKTPGDWHVRYDSPTMAHHHVKKSMPITEWLQEFYGIEFAYKKTVSTGDYLAKQRTERWAIKKKIRSY
jgi:hypothetical protein